MKQPHHILAVRIAHPVWTLFLLALALAVDHTGIVRLGLLCSCLHECGHLLVWVLLTRLPPTLIICPTGFCLSLRGVVLAPKQFIILAAAGPAVNLVRAAVSGVWAATCRSTPRNSAKVSCVKRTTLREPSVFQKSGPGWASA